MAPPLAWGIPRFCRIPIQVQRGQSVFRLDTTNMNFDQPLKGSLVNSSGTLVIEAGRVLSRADLELLQRAFVDGLFLGDDWPTHERAKLQAAG